MQISMELLSQMVSRTDSGAGAKTDKKEVALTVSTANPSFKKILEDSRPVKEDPMMTERGNQRIEGGNNRKKPDMPQKPDDEEDMEIAAAGAAVNQAMVVFILEGDMESTTVPEVPIEAKADIGAVTQNTRLEDTGITLEHEQNPGSKLDEDVAEFKQVLEDAREVSASDVTTAFQQTEKSDTRVTEANTGKPARTDNPEPIGPNENAGATGEVMARTPTNRTSQQTGNDDSEYGDPSLLENENDTAVVKGQKGKTYADAIRDALNEKNGASTGVEHATPPLAEGLKPEQFRADQQMRMAAPEAHVEAEKLFDEMVSRIETMQTDTKSAMTIQLKPEFLGKVALEIAVDATGLHVKINAEDSGVRSMINGQMAALIESLENKGISVVEVEVAYTGIDNGAFKDSQEGRSQPEQSRRPHRDRETDLVYGAAYYAALSFDALGYLLEEDVSSVEYRA